MRVADFRFNNDLRYRDDSHDRQRRLTPQYVLGPARAALGGRIDLDPCTEPDNPTNARRFYTPPADGAELPWDAETIWCNPPYGKARERWAQRCMNAGYWGSKVLLLIPSHTDTRLFQRLTISANFFVLLKGRLKFGIPRANGRQEAASHPSAIFAWNADPDPLRCLGQIVKKS